MSEDTTKPGGELLLYTTEDGRSRVECRFLGDNLWLSQALMAELYQKDVRTINEHLRNLFDEGELDPGATIRKFRMVRQEGVRQVTREIEHYNLDASAFSPRWHQVSARPGSSIRQAFFVLVL